MQKRHMLSAALLGCTATAAVQSENRPNIVFILADDMGYGDVKKIKRRV